MDNLLERLYNYGEWGELCEKPIDEYRDNTTQLFTIWESDEEECKEFDNIEACGICGKPVKIDETACWNPDFGGYICYYFIENGCQFRYNQIFEMQRYIELCRITREMNMEIKPCKRYPNTKWYSGKTIGKKKVYITSFECI
jgi:hypothetical protein